MLNQKTIKIIKSTVPVLEENGVLLTKHFYQKIFENNPEVMSLFNKSNQEKGTQQEALAGAICAYAKNIDNLEALQGAVKLISHKHFSLKIKPEHYPIVGTNLLESIKDVLGEAATPDIIEAWSQAYFFLADILIDAEKSLSNKQDSYDNFKKFKVLNIVDESELIKSFYLSPLDGKLPVFSSGQYITIRTPFDDITTMRNYSLSVFGEANYLRISVKREIGNMEKPEGYVSNYLHQNIKIEDEIEVGAPAGVFTLNKPEDKEAVKEVSFIAGGIGVTPLLSMLYDSLGNKEQFPSINFVHANQNDNVQAFRNEIEKLSSENSQLNVDFFYDSLTRDRGDNEYIGHISKDYLSKLSNKSTYYICGPKAFMSSIVRNLKELGVNDNDINFEFFGPLESLEL